MHGPGHRDPARAGPLIGGYRQQAHPAEPVQRLMACAMVHGQARLGERAGDVAGERRERVAVRQPAPVGAGQRGFRLGEFRALGGGTQCGEVRLTGIFVRHAGPP